MCWGGSNAIGAFSEYLNSNVELIIVEAAGKGIESGYSAATSVLGRPGIIHGSKTMLMQDDSGQILEPYSISAGLDYPGIGPVHAHLIDVSRACVESVTDDEAVASAFELAKMEGIIPALESSHALAALKKVDVKGQIVVVNLSGRGDKDLETLIKYKNRIA